MPLPDGTTLHVPVDSPSMRPAEPLPQPVPGSSRAGSHPRLRVRRSIPFLLAAVAASILPGQLRIESAGAQALSTPPAPALPASPQNRPISPGTAAETGAAGGSMVTIESDQQLADNRTGIVTATGNVRITYPERGLVATARQAQYFSREARLVLSGDVEVIDGDGQRIRAERLVYRLDSERLQAEPIAGRQVVSKLRLQPPSGSGPTPAPRP